VKVIKHLSHPSPRPRSVARTVCTVCAGASAVGALLFLALAWLRGQALYDARLPMKNLIIGMLQYAAEYGDGSLPPESGYRGLVALHAAGLLGEQDVEILLDPCRLSGTNWPDLSEEDVAYWYVGGRRSGDPPGSIVLVLKKGGKWGYVAYLDGRVLRERGERWEALRASVPDIEHRIWW